MTMTMGMTELPPEARAALGGDIPLDYVLRGITLNDAIRFAGMGADYQRDVLTRVNACIRHAMTYAIPTNGGASIPREAYPLTAGELEILLGQFLSDKEPSAS